MSKFSVGKSMDHGLALPLAAIALLAVGGLSGCRLTPALPPTHGLPSPSATLLGGSPTLEPTTAPVQPSLTPGEPAVTATATSLPTPTPTRVPVPVEEIQGGEHPYDQGFAGLLTGLPACLPQPDEDWAASFLVHDLSRDRPLAVHNIDQQMPVASAFKGPVLFYALSQIDPGVTGSVPVEYWSQKGDIPESYLPHLREHWILSHLYNMVVHSSNRAAGQVLDYVYDQDPSGENPLHKFNAWSRDVVQTSPDSGLYQWQHPPLEGVVDPSSPPQDVRGRCGSVYSHANTFSARDLGLYYQWMAEEAPDHVRELSSELLSIVEEEPGYLETTAVRLRGRSVSKAGYFGGGNSSFVWIDSGLILLEGGQEYLVVTATLNASELLLPLYEEIERVIQIENDLPRTHIINSIHIPDWAARLGEVASSYQADTSQAAEKVAQEIDFIKGDAVEGSSTMCGPLSAAMLRDAGLLDPGIDLEQFWLPDPLRNGRPWSLFDLTDYDLFGFRSPEFSLNRFDFRQFPLLPGDLIYTHGGSGTHVFVVTEVDEDGRAYTVTNYCIDREDCPIQRMLLYDPDQPGVGAFYNEFQQGWFRTGQRGFDLLRTKDYPRIYPVWYDKFLLHD